MSITLNDKQQSDSTYFASAFWLYSLVAPSN